MMCGCGLLMVVMVIRVFSFHLAWFNENPSIEQLSSCHERRKGGRDQEESSIFARCQLVMRLWCSLHSTASPNLAKGPREMM